MPTNATFSCGTLTFVRNVVAVESASVLGMVNPLGFVDARMA